MGRAWRIEYEGALYHILSRGNEQGDIFYDNTDRRRFLDTIGYLIWQTGLLTNEKIGAIFELTQFISHPDLSG